jgi:hypothetical protein
MPRKSEDTASINAGLILPECIDSVVPFIPVPSSIPAKDIARWPARGGVRGVIPERRVY